MAVSECKSKRIITAIPTVFPTFITIIWFTDCWLETFFSHWHKSVAE
jgi:hypothetical protein